MSWVRIRCVEKCVCDVMSASPHRDGLLETRKMKKRNKWDRGGTRGICLLFCLCFCRVLSPRRSCDPSASPQQEPAVDTEPQADLPNLLGFAALTRSPQQDAQLTGRIRGGEG